MSFIVRIVNGSKNEFAEIATKSEAEALVAIDPENRDLKEVPNVFDPVEICQKLHQGVNPEDLGLTPGSVSAARMACYWSGRLFFTRKDGDWYWGHASENGVSAYPGGRVTPEGDIFAPVYTWNPYVKRDTTHWDGPWEKTTPEAERQSSLMCAYW